MMHKWRWQIEVLATRYGLWLVPGCVAVLFALAAWFVWLPAQDRALQDALFELAEQGRTGKAKPHMGTATDPTRWPDTLAATNALQHLFSLAKDQGLSVAQADYQRHETGRIGRWQVLLPASGNYRQLRQFLRAAQGMPNLSLDELTLHQSDVGVDAQLHFSIWFSTGAAPAVQPEGKN